ncbi:MAG: flagellar biosynthesis protein FliQ [Gammaproteobacteria bacterium]|nr:flagellar biosynthesis protein FliQ [Gammaproteobacteria bacterium]
MTIQTVIMIGQHAIEIMVLLLSVLLLPALAVGLLVSLFQAATQINEMTLSFIPKLLVTFGVMVVAGPWMLRLLVDYFTRLLGNIPGLIG